jgi:hypothetical protein
MSRRATASTSAVPLIAEEASQISYFDVVCAAACEETELPGVNSCFDIEQPKHPSRSLLSFGVAIR